jgi:hypothetical protein
MKVQNFPEFCFAQINSKYTGFQTYLIKNAKRHEIPMRTRVQQAEGPVEAGTENTYFSSCPWARVGGGGVSLMPN